MVSFLEGVDPGLTEFLHNPPYIPTIVVPRVPATATIAEVPEQIRPKDEKDWSPQERLRHDLAGKCRRLLIMAIPRFLSHWMHATFPKSFGQSYKNNSKVV